jgi:hypothetical protein
MGHVKPDQEASRVGLTLRGARTDGPEFGSAGQHLTARRADHGMMRVYFVPSTDVPAIRPA